MSETSADFKGAIICIKHGHPVDPSSSRVGVDMDANFTALAVAVVGVAGTLLAALLTQRSYMRTKQLELMEQRERYEEEKVLLYLRERREIYGALNAATRNYRSTIKSLLFGNAPDMDQIQSARREFDRRLAEVQLIATEQVLDSAHRAMRKLNDTFGIVVEFTRSANSDAEPGERRALIAELDGPVFDAIRAMRVAMRSDLGVDKPQALAESPSIDTHRSEAQPLVDAPD